MRVPVLSPPGKSARTQPSTSHQPQRPMPSNVPSEAAYHLDPYRKEIEVWVDEEGVDYQHGPFLVFSETICHPHGGGQKGDRGLLHLGPELADKLGCAEQLPILDTRKGERSVLHLLARKLDEEAAAEHLVGTQRLRFSLDWEFRHRQMRLHSTAHLLHCFVERVLDAPVPYPSTSDLQPEFGLNRYDTKQLLDDQQAQEVIRRLNAFTAEGHEISTYPDAEREGFRYWQCGDWVIPCGGTHPENTREIGKVETSLSMKRGRTSLKFWLET